MPAVYSFDVTVSTHDDLKRGVAALHVLGAQHPWHRIVVAADNHSEAFHTAFAMLYVQGWYPTGIYDRI